MCDKSTRKYTLWQVYIWLKLEWSKTWSKTCPKKEKICFCLTRSITHFFNVKKFYILHSLKSKICTKTKYKSFHMKSFLITHYFLLFIEFDKVASYMQIYRFNSFEYGNHFRILNARMVRVYHGSEFIRQSCIIG